jgi:hypothetical protein
MAQLDSHEDNDTAGLWMKANGLKLARSTHERFCCNRRSAAATSLGPAGSPLRPSMYCMRTHQALRAPRTGLAMRLSDFTTNRHE